MIDLTTILDNKGTLAGILTAIVGLVTAWKNRSSLWGQIRKVLPVKAATTSEPDIASAFAAIETLATYAKATGNHSLSRSVINAFEDVANVPEPKPAE